MTLTLDLPPDLETRLHDEATRRGLSVNELALSVLEKGITAEELPRTPRETRAYWDREGLSRLWADRTDLPDSPEYARQLRGQAEHREDR